MDGAVELVARESELTRLRRALGRAQAGRGCLVLITGDAGLGKSALCGAALHEAEALGAKVVLGRAWELGEAPPYFPLMPCFATLGLDAPALAAEPNAFRVWERLLPALAHAAASSLVVLVLEDLHAADLATLDLLALLAQPLGALRAVVIGTARLKDPRVTERVEQRLTRMARDGEQVRLEPLGPDSVRELAQRSLGRQLSDATARELFARTGGNPLFVVECALALRTQGASPTSLPSTVRQVVLDRVRLLPDHTGRVLAAAAVLGREATALTLARLTGDLPAQVIDALEPALRAGLLDELAPGRYAFPHILVRDAIEDGLAASERRQLHAAASAALAALGDDPEILVERARHALCSLSGGATTLELGLRAVALLERRGAFDRAHAMYERIAAARRGGLGEPAMPVERLHAARIAQRAGHFPAARAACLELVAQARATDDPELFAQAALAFGAEIRPGVVDRELVALLEEARARLPDTKCALGARVLARLAAGLQPAVDPSVPVALAREALALARAVDDEPTLVETLFVAGAALCEYNPLDERLAVAEELVQRATARGDLASAGRGYERLAMTYAELGRFADWDTAVDRLLALSDELGTPRQRWRGLLHASMRALARGDVSLSNRTIHEVSELETVSDDGMLTLSLRAHWGSRAILLHRDDEIRRTIETFIKLPPNLPEAEVIAAAIRGSGFAKLEDAPAAAAELERLRGFVEHAPELGYFGVLAAETSAFAADAPMCQTLRHRLATEGAPHVVGGHVPVIYAGPRLRVLGLLASALGEHATAAGELRAARALASEHGFTPWVAQLDYELGVALERAGKRDDAGAHFAQAAAAASELPMPGLLERARTRLSALAGPRRAAVESVLPAAAPPRFTLERRGDVWQLDYAGSSASVKDSRGMQLLARLVERPGEELHVLALASDDAGTSLFDGGSGEALDARAKRAYGERLAELEGELAQAEQDNDRGRLETLERERELLDRELAQALGLGGRPRASGSPSERARVNVQRRLKDAIGRITEVLPDCGRFLERAVRTGNYCIFNG